MALKAQVESLDGLPPDVAKEYKEVKDESGTRYILDTEGVEDVTGLKSALRKERETKGALEKAIKKLGLKPDPKAIEEVLEKVGDKTIEELLAEVTAKSGDVEAAEKRGESKIQRKLNEATETIQHQSSFIQKLVRENQLRAAILEAEGNDVLLLPAMEKFVKVVEQDGTEGKEYVAQVVDAKGNARTGKGGAEFTLKDLVAEYKADAKYEGAFSGTGASGSGAQESGPTKRSGAPATGSKTKDAVAEKRRTLNYSI